MKKLKVKDFLILTILLMIILLGNSLRSFNYDKVPHPGETADEYVFAWAGLNIIKEGVPAGWTGVGSGYKNIWYEEINVDQVAEKNPEWSTFRMTKPWFDKPPGFALITGAYSYLKGAREFFQTGVGILRRMMLKIAIVNTILIFVLATRLYDKWVGLVSSLLYSIIPTTVISSRLVLSENGYIPIFLGALILLDLYFEKDKKIYLYFAGSLSALAILFKLSGISVLLSLILLIALIGKNKQKIKDISTIFMIGITGFAAFVVYGAILDWQVFKDVFFAQSNLLYGAGAEVFFSVIVRSKVTDTGFFTDGWVTLAWISTLIISYSEFKKEKGAKFITVSIFSYLIIFLIFGSEGYGWYRFPFLPFIIIGLARLMQKLFSEPNLLLFLGLSLLPFGTGVHRLIGIEGFSQYVLHLRIFMVFITMLYFLLLATQSTLVKKAVQITMVVVFIFLIYLAYFEIHYLNYDNWFYIT